MEVLCLSAFCISGPSYREALRCSLVSLYVSSAVISSLIVSCRRLFEEHQELLNLFEKFRELRTRDEQANSMELAEHANTVMTTLDEGIKALDNLDSFFDFLTQVGASHHRIPGFKPEYFWVR